MVARFMEELTKYSRYSNIFTTVNIMSYREYIPNTGLLTQGLKTPERLWMSILLINHYQSTPTVHEFSALSGLSVGLISKFANIMREAGFLAHGQRLKLVKPGLLLDIVRDLYYFEANQIISYYSEETPEQIIRKIAHVKKPYALTRICGASLVAPFVRGQRVDIYIPGPGSLADWKKTLNLVDVEVTGNVNLVIPQAPQILKQLQTVKGCHVVNSTQLYLDLYKYPARGREQAEHLREQVLKI